MNVLISGLGIAGTTLAWWLHRLGMDPVVVEASPSPRDDGESVELGGLGYEVARRMHILEELKTRAYVLDNEKPSKRKSGHPGANSFKSYLETTRGNRLSLGRGDLAKTLRYGIEGRCEILFNERILHLEQHSFGVEVELARTGNRRFDLVIGADGTHSKTREMVFGEEDQFARYLGFGYATFKVPNYEAKNRHLDWVDRKQKHRVARFSPRNGYVQGLLIFEEKYEREYSQVREEQIHLLRDHFTGAGWEMPEIFETLERAEDIKIEPVNQIYTDRWHHGRIALVGDAAYAPSLFAGQGLSLAMAGAYVLAGELARTESNYNRGYESYQNRLFNYVSNQQKRALSYTATLTSTSQLGDRIYSVLRKSFGKPLLARLNPRNGESCNLELPDYARLQGEKHRGA